MRYYLMSDVRQDVRGISHALQDPVLVISPRNVDIVRDCIVRSNSSNCDVERWKREMRRVWRHDQRHLTTDCQIRGDVYANPVLTWLKGIDEYGIGVNGIGVCTSSASRLFV